MKRKRGRPLSSCTEEQRGRDAVKELLFPLLFYSSPRTAKSPSDSATYVGTATAPSFSKSARESIPMDERTVSISSEARKRVEKGRRTGENHERVDTAVVTEGDVGVETVSNHDHLALVELVAAKGARKRSRGVGKEEKNATYVCTILSSIGASGLPTTRGSRPSAHDRGATVAPPPAYGRESQKRLNEGREAKATYRGARCRV